MRCAVLFRGPLQNCKQKQPFFPSWSTPWWPEAEWCEWANQEERGRGRGGEGAGEMLPASKAPSLPLTITQAWRRCLTDCPSTLYHRAFTSTNTTPIPISSRPSTVPGFRWS